MYHNVLCTLYIEPPLHTYFDEILGEVVGHDVDEGALHEVGALQVEVGAGGHDADVTLEALCYTVKWRAAGLASSYEEQLTSSD